MKSAQAVQESLSGIHATVAKALPGEVTVLRRTRNAYVLVDGFTAAMIVGDDSGERAEVIARAIASHDHLVSMVKGFGPEVGRNVLLESRPDATLAEVAGMIFEEMPIGGEESLSRATALAQIIIDRCGGRGMELVLRNVLDEVDAVRAELRSTGHSFEGARLSHLVDRAIDTERERREADVGRLQGRINAIREAASA